MNFFIDFLIKAFTYPSISEAVEPTSCPTMTRGPFAYDLGDTVQMTPLLPIHTLGHNFVSAPIHTGGGDTTA